MKFILVSGKLLVYLFIVYVTTLSVAHTMLRRMIGWTMNWKGYGRKRSWPNLRHHTGIWLEGRRKTTMSNEFLWYGKKWSWPNLRHHSGICLEGLRKITKTSVRISSPGRDLNTGPTESKAGVPTVRPRHSVKNPVVEFISKCFWRCCCITAIYYLDLYIVSVFCNHNVSRDGSSLVIRWTLPWWIRSIELASIAVIIVCNKVHSCKIPL
jgi:hypothetical protein